MTVELPQEIVDLIIREAKSDYATLRQCASISRSFLASSQRHLYASITLSSAPQCERLCGALSSNPELVPLVHELRIMDGWAHDCAAFHSVIGLLADGGSALESLKFIHPHTPKTQSTHPFLFHNSAPMKRLLMSPSLRSLSVDHVPLCSFPIRLLMSAPSLRELSLRAPECLFCSPEARASRNIKSAPALASSLRTLDIRGDHLNLLLRYAWSSLLHLRKLRISTPNNTLYSLVQELLEISDEVVSFRWDYPVCKFFCSWRPCALKFPRNLRLVIFTHWDYTILARSLDLIAESAVLPPSIEQIVLLSDNPVGTMPVLEEKELDRRLTTTFTDKTRYPCLRDIYLLHDRAANAWRSESLSTRENVCLPELRATGLLKVVEGSRRELQNVLESLEAAMLG